MVKIKCPGDRPFHGGEGTWYKIPSSFPPSPHPSSLSNIFTLIGALNAACSVIRGVQFVCNATFSCETIFFLVDENPTIFIFFEVGEFYDKDLTEMIGGNLANSLALIPNDAKLLITQRVKLDKEVSNSFHVRFDRSDHDFVTTMLEVIHKRWQILDLKSVVEEALRTQRVKRPCSY